MYKKVFSRESSSNFYLNISRMYCHFKVILKKLHMVLQLFHWKVASYFQKLKKSSGSLRNCLRISISFLQDFIAVVIWRFLCADLFKKNYQNYFSSSRDNIKKIRYPSTFFVEFQLGLPRVFHGILSMIFSSILPA